MIFLVADDSDRIAPSADQHAQSLRVRWHFLDWSYCPNELVLISPMISARTGELKSRVHQEHCIFEIMEITSGFWTSKLGLGSVSILPCSIDCSLTKN